MLKPNKLLVVFITIIILGGGLLFAFWKNKTEPISPQLGPQAATKPVTQNDPPQIVATKPNPLDNSFISTTDIVEITFNRSLENVGEFKSKLSPEIEYRVELSNERKTAKIIPSKSYSLGTTYTLFIGTETKFDGVGRWGQEKIFHFRTITYRGV